MFAATLAYFQFMFLHSTARFHGQISLAKNCFWCPFPNFFKHTYLHNLESTIKVKLCSDATCQGGHNVTENQTYKQASNDHGEAGKYWWIEIRINMARVLFWMVSEDLLLKRPTIVKIASQETTGTFISQFSE